MQAEPKGADTLAKEVSTLRDDNPEQPQPNCAGAMHRSLLSTGTSTQHPNLTQRHPTNRGNLLVHPPTSNIANRTATGNKLLCVCASWYDKAL